MKSDRNPSRRLAWKLFLSYLAVILVGVAVLAVAAEFAIPNAFGRHMSGMMGDEMMGGMGMMGEAEGDLFASFRAAFNETLLLAAFAAVLVAGAASYLIARRIIAPVLALTAASRRIAAGEYGERVPLPSQPGREDELDQLAGSFNTMAAQLEQTEAMRRRLIGDIAHELRTPLTTIQGSLEALVDGVLPADPATFRQLHLEADRLGRLVNDLQELSRVESGAFRLELKPIRVETLVQAVAARIRPRYDGKGVALGVDPADELPPVTADEDRIIQVLTNLLDNALQYTPGNGSVRVRITTAGRRELERRLTGIGDEPAPAGRWVLVSVVDTGIGISPADQPHIFDRFYRADKSRSRTGGGSGIGLTIARRLVEAHGGRIWVESAGVGVGSIFTFCLPAGGSGDGAANP
ncbi:MAG TPA: ATP-binding protein [Anaerolineales bacterium]|nr:ATP-binding protein [Anaerolineales bacterium]